jgi:hypothetical protein
VSGDDADARLHSEVVGSSCFAAKAPGYQNWIEAVGGDIRHRIIRGPRSLSRRGLGPAVQ